MENKKRIKIGVAGAGSMGNNHIRILSELNGMFDLVGIYDPIPERARVAEKYGVISFPDYDSMLDEVEAVSLPCPTSLHKKMALRAAEAGVHTLVEKPIAETLSDAVELYNTFKGTGLKFTVGHVERYNPVVRALSEIIKQTEVVAVEAHRCSPFDPRIFDVDVVSDLMVHDIDIVLNSVFDSCPERITAIGKKVFTESFVDYAQASMTFSNGALAFITASRSTQDKIRTICVHTKGSYIEGDMLRRTLTVKRGVNYVESNTGPHVEYKQSSVTEQIALPNVEPLKEELKNFGESILFDKEPLVTGFEVIRAMSTLDKIKEAIY